MTELKELFPGVFLLGNKLATKSLVPGYKVYGEELVKVKGEEYRMWDARRSKLAAAIRNGLKELPIRPGGKVLYLGAASGTTPSHISDIVGPEGTVFCVEFAPRPFRDLITVCERRQNMLPILGDARKPKEYRQYINSAECLFEDVAQPDQTRILAINAKEYLKPGDPAMIAIKSQSIDAIQSPKKTFEDAIAELEKEFELVQKVSLEPFEKDHLFASLKLKR